MNKLTLEIVAAIFSTSVSASWPIVDIGGLGGKDFYASSINDSGQIAGSFYDNNTFLWDAFVTGANGSNIKEIGSAPDTFVTASQINNSGQVIVQSFSLSSGDRKYSIAEPNGNHTELNTISAINGHAYGINDSGVVAGYYFSSEKGFRSFITDENINFIKDIGSLSESLTVANAINNSGQVVGYSINERGNSRAFITNSDGTGIRDLGSLDPKFYNKSSASDINESGQVVGGSSMNGTWSQAFITGEDGIGMISMGTLGGLSSDAVAVNDAGIAIGTSLTSDWSTHSFIYANGEV